MGKQLRNIQDNLPPKSIFELISLLVIPYSCQPNSFFKISYMTGYTHKTLKIEFRHFPLGASGAKDPPKH